jgi:hypothetical protein
MKKIVLTLIGVFAILTLIAQPPQRFQPQRQLPNQFRDFVDHQQRMSFEKPEIKKENGKVIITMSEAQFEKMREMRMRQRNSMRHASFRFQHCDKCENSHKKHMKKRLPNTKRRF